MDADTLLTALIVFAGGSADDKCTAAFFCTDANDDGFLDRKEMLAYMQTFFQVPGKLARSLRRRRC